MIADETADPEACIADLLAQASTAPTGVDPGDHERGLADAVAARVGDRAEVELVKDEDEAIALSNQIAPEHLHVSTADPDRLAERLTNAGAIFLGHETPVAVGDYAAGSNHVLPTGGLARGVGGLGLEAFLKSVQFVRATPEALASVRPTIEAFAALEGLPLHAESVAVRA